jgi:hypothetical protein
MDQYYPIVPGFQGSRNVRKLGMSGSEPEEDMAARQRHCGYNCISG